MTVGEVFSRQGVQVRVVAEVERVMSNINLVASGTGVSIVPASMEGTHAQSVVYRPLPRSAGLDAPITLVRREDSDGPVADRFLALVRRIARQPPKAPRKTRRPSSARAAARC